MFFLLHEKLPCAHCLTRSHYKNNEASVRQGQFWSMKWSKVSKCFDILVSSLVSYFTLASLTSLMFTLSFRLHLFVLLCLLYRCELGLNAYGFGFDSLKLINNYLSHRKQRTEINHSYCSWKRVLFAVLQGSILGPILLNIFLSDLFLFIKETDFASYADDNTIFKASNNISDVIAYYNSHPKRFFRWFSNK